VHDYAIRREENWNKFSSCWVMSQSRRQSNTSGKQRFPDAVDDHIGLETDVPVMIDVAGES
jgi:hypothetical protein